MAIKQRTPEVAFDDIPGSLPNASIPGNVDLPAVAQSSVTKLNSLNESHLAANAIWRDILALTGYYRTFNGPQTVLATLKKLSTQKKRSVFRVKENREPRIGRSARGSSWVDIDVLFTAQQGNLAQNCMGTVSVILDGDGLWRIWMLRTWLECFDGYGHPDVLEPQQRLSKNVLAEQEETNVLSNGVIHEDNMEYGAIVVGAGQAGLAVGGRLKALGVSYIVLDNRDEVGDVWNNRYESLRWHTSKEYGNLPFGHTYPETDDYAMPTKRIGAGHKGWSEKYGINVSTKTAVESASWNNSVWTVTASTPKGTISFKAKNLVLAIGPGHATPTYPAWATADEVKSSGFTGTILHAFDGVGRFVKCDLS